MKKIFKIIFILIFISHNSIQAQEIIEIEWDNKYGGYSSDMLYDFQMTSDSGFIAIGTTWDNSYIGDGDFEGFRGEYDYSILKIDKYGNVQWTKCYGGTKYDMGTSIKQTTDGGYIIAGYSYSNTWDILCSDAYGKAWIAKLDEYGEIEWSNCYGDHFSDKIHNIQQTNDYGFLAIGSSNNTGFQEDFWILKLDENGNVIWSKSYGGSDDDYGYYGIQTESGEYMIVGSTKSINYDVSGNHGQRDSWILKLDIYGNIIWSKCFGGTETELTSCIIETNDSNFVVIGSSSSSNMYSCNTNGEADAWIFKINQNGDVLWSKTYGGEQVDIAWTASKSNNGYIIAASKDMYDQANESDYWIMELNLNGDTLWTQLFNKGPYVENSMSVIQTEENKFVIAGSCEDSMRTNDFWVFKINLKTESIVKLSNESDINIYPNPANDQLTIDGSIKNSLIQIYNISGNIVYHNYSKTNNFSINLNKYHKGVYFVKIINKNQTITKKLIVK